MEPKPSDTSFSGIGTPLFQWQAPEHEDFELGPRSRMITTSLLIVIIGYALLTNSPLMAITFILIGVVGYLLQHQEPRILTYALTTKGAVLGKDFYRYNTIESFHIYTEYPFENLLSLKVNGTLLSHVHVPLPEGERDTIYRSLREFVPEDTHEPSLVDTLEKFLHI
ncbi:MAG: hypothetical protein A2808_00155 [Candidatus Moranbacteria bacterium RIFCSPHIGHO2_01_FULL_55_24]|nr:MAG: hypothetical protein A2808_00155 [Candidatus Moranbacteria bacterium RIFCSPHIGHO2_01_FULL_55_24]